MISYLHIKNIALIQELSLELKSGLNILSGETGAGKSIIIDSLTFVLGDRADRSLIRHGETMARVEVVFDHILNRAEVDALLNENGIDAEDETVIVTRLMTNEKSECRINGRIVTLSILRAVVALLIDIHTQNEHQSLLKVSNHILLLDAFSDKIPALKNSYQKARTEYQQVTKRIRDFSSKEERERRIDILSFQVDEIEKNRPLAGEEEELTAKRGRFYNAQKIELALTNSVQHLDGCQGIGAVPSLQQAIRELNTILKYDETLSDIIDRLDAVSIEISDIQDTLSDKRSEESDEQSILAVEKRLEEIRALKRKYGKFPEEIDAFCEKVKTELDELLSAETILSDLQTKQEALTCSLSASATAMHKERMRISKMFTSSIGENLSELGMKNSVFEVQIEFNEDLESGMNQNGCDTVEFMLSPNLGEPVKPLAKIASGGEMSRFMLALKNVIAEVDSIGTLVFDEIDTGISGAIARVVAMKLYDIAKTRQVIAITHLPQLASMADINFLIEKRVVEHKTLTFIQELTGDEITREIMRLSGAMDNSEIGMSNAKELKYWANRYKLEQKK